ncbi:hypothetical protein ACSVDA_00560 [Cytobacillus sp. Hm23]
MKKIVLLIAMLSIISISSNTLSIDHTYEYKHNNSERGLSLNEWEPGPFSPKV